ncbi:hypothetical protein ADEAN_001001500 [Angomonas deanei]|uniref:Uncharacterized protein n=1 Tax=Angomonas deanei TaxID=59799 RepID=A0A7G2CTS6_9TRYP|nr:hypothetical protein ADEAN_001001500 [Angomonas deanei]
MGKILQALTKPVTVPVAACRRSVAAMTGPLKQHIDIHEKQGEDVCTLVWQEYVHAQRHLVGYRFQKFISECKYIASGEMAIATFEKTDLLLLLRWLTKCLALFLAFTLVGRRSIYPPLEPHSPFLEEAVANWPVTHVDAAFGRIPAETVYYLKEIRATEPTK